MLRVEMHKQLRQPSSVEASRVVVYDRCGNPISITVEMDANNFLVAHVGDPDFTEVLKSLGIIKTVLVTDFQQKPINEIRFPNSG